MLVIKIIAMARDAKVLPADKNVARSEHDKQSKRG